MKYLCTILFLLFSAHLASAQSSVKVEIERSIKDTDIPFQLQQDLQELIQLSKNINYFEEKDSVNTYYEIKLRSQKRILSIKYDRFGELVDIEEKVKLSDLPQFIQDSLSNFFNTEYKNHKYKKIQKRYTSDSEEALSDFIAGNNGELILSYEIEAYIKSESKKKTGLNEFQFNELGELIRSRKISSRSADYVMY